MTAVLDELQRTELATSIHGLSPVGAAAILAETGDPSRFATARALVKHAGLAPREKKPESLGHIPTIDGASIWAKWGAQSGRIGAVGLPYRRLVH
jgi:transposase